MPIHALLKQSDTLLEIEPSIPNSSKNAEQDLFKAYRDLTCNWLAVRSTLVRV
jgi:hypothetical protein